MFAQKQLFSFAIRHTKASSRSLHSCFNSFKNVKSLSACSQVTPPNHQAFSQRSFSTSAVRHFENSNQHDQQSSSFANNDQANANNANIIQATQLWSNGKYMEAIRFLLEATPQTPEVVEQAGDYYLVLGEPAKAMAQYSKLPYESTLYIKQASALEALGEFDKAEQLLVEVLNKDTNNANIVPKVWYSRAALAMKRAMTLPKNNAANYQQAIKHFSLAITPLQEAFDKPTSTDNDDKIKLALIEAYLGRAMAHHKLQELDKAIDDYRQITKIDPHNAMARISCGDCLSMTGKYKDALACYNNALDNLQDMAKLHRSEGNSITAKSYEQLYYELLLKLATSHLQLSEYEMAEFYLGGIIDNTQDPIANRFKGFAYNLKGIAASKQEQYSSAVKFQTEALRYNPDLAEAYYERAQAYKALEKDNLAKDDLHMREFLLRQRLVGKKK